MNDIVQSIRKQFPILDLQVHGHPLVYLDHASTTHKPRCVVEREAEFYFKENANVHRGIYWLSEKASSEFEAVRGKVREFIGARSDREIIFTRGTTEAINCVANSWGNANIREGDLVVVSRMDHHASFVTWQALCKRVGARFEIAELDSEYQFDLNYFQRLMEKKPKLVSLPWVSNVLGVVNPIAQLSELAHAAGAKVLIDAAQAVMHFPINLRLLPNVDFMAFSSHKMCGPTGVGVLWGKSEILENMAPFQYGGDMILKVDDHSTEFNEIPYRFEAGTPNIAGTIGLGAAIDFLTDIGLDKIEKWDRELTSYAMSRLKEITGLRLIGPSKLDGRVGVFSFVVDGVHPHDLAQFLDHQGLAVRAGHHCAQPLIHKLGLMATTRASLSLTTTRAEIDALVSPLKAAREYFSERKQKCRI